MHTSPGRGAPRRRAKGTKMLASLAAGAAMLAASGTAASAGARSSPVPITFWTAMSGANGTYLNHLVSEFNASQSAYKVTADYKGNYTTVLSDTIAAFRAHQAPNISMVFDAGTATVMDSVGAYVPVYKLMAQNHIPFSTSDFIGGAASYYETAQDNLDSMPFNSSTPVLYYNKKELSAAGITEPPHTWTQLAVDAHQLAAHGQACALSSSGAYIMWTDIEQFAVWNGYPLATKDNGYQSDQGVKLEIDTPPFIDHLKLLGELAQKGEFRWNGVANSTVPLFTDGTCAMYQNSSASGATIEKGIGSSSFGVAPLPVVAGDAAAPQNTVVGGASLWVMAGAPSDTYTGDAEFLHFLMSGPSQAYWASNTGYVAVTKAGVYSLRESGFYKKDPAALVPVHELTNKPALAWTRGVRLGYLPEIRNIEVTAITAVLSGKQSAAQALAAAQSSGDQILAQFAQQYRG
ncbi:MAG: extracellular solute-binding protein [Acidimicrobiales bacterium]